MAFSILSANTEPLVCVDFFLLENRHKVLFKLFSQDPHFCNTRLFVHSSVSLVKSDCFLHIVKHISTLCNNFPAESILEQSI